MQAAAALGMSICPRVSSPQVAASKLNSTSHHHHGTTSQQIHGGIRACALSTSTHNFCCVLLLFARTLLLLPQNCWPPSIILNYYSCRCTRAKHRQTPHLARCCAAFSLCSGRQLLFSIISEKTWDPGTTRQSQAEALFGVRGTARNHGCASDSQRV